MSGAFAVLLSIPTALAYTSITLLIPVFNIGVFVLAGPRITLSTVSFTGCVFALFLVTAGRARRWGDWAEAKRKALEWAFLTEHREARGMAGLDFEDPLDDEKLDPNLADATKILFFGRTKELPKEKPR